jgi:hypothetical protein
MRFAVTWLAWAAIAGAWAPAPAPATAGWTQECRAAAAQAGFPVACPRSWPAGAFTFWANGVGSRTCAGGRVTRRRWTWVGAEVGRGAIVYASAPGRVSPRRLTDALRATAAIAAWHAGGRTYAVGVSGRLHDRRLAARLARTAVLVVAAPSARPRSQPRTR